MKKGSPISLFSFQDIITCLTGIMIVIVLIIMLQLVNATMVQHVNTGDNQRLEELRKQEKALLAYQENISRELPTEMDMSMVEYAKYSPEDLESLLKQKEQEEQALREKISDLERNLQRLDVVDKLKENEEELRKELAELRKNEKRLQELQAQLAAMKRQKEEVKDTIKVKRKSLRFEFAGHRDVKPLIIECNSWGFRVQKYPDGEIVTFGTKSDKASVNIDKMVSYVRQFDRNKYYPLLCFREGTLKYEEKIMKFFSDVNIGRELIGSGEECFYNE